MVNTPHNPTGAMLSEAELRRVYALAESLGARVLCDEAYRWLDVPGGDPFAPPMRDLGDAGVSVGTFSKPFGLPGLRTGQGNLMPDGNVVIIGKTDWQWTPDGEQTTITPMGTVARNLSAILAGKPLDAGSDASGSARRAA